MGGEKLKTTIEIAVDDRQVRGLGRGIETALSPRTVDRFSKGILQATAAMEKLARAQRGIVESLTQSAKLQEQMARAAERSDRQRQREPGRGGGDGREGGRGDDRGFWERSHSLAQRGGAAAASAVPREGFIGQAMSGIPIIGPALGAIVSAIQQFSAYRSAMDATYSQGYGRTGLSQMSPHARAAFADIGVSEDQAAGQIGSLSSAGKLGGRELDSILPYAARLQGEGGVDLGQTGALLGGARTGTNASQSEQDMHELLEDAVDSGMQSGLRHQQIGEYLERMGGTLHELRSRGFMVDPRSLTALTRFNAQSGLTGDRAVNAAISMSAGVGKANRGTGLLSQLSMEVAGLGQGRTQAQATRYLQTHQGEVTQGVIQRFRDSPGSVEDRALAMVNAFAGTYDISQEDAENLIRGGRLDGNLDTSRGAVHDRVAGSLLASRRAAGSTRVGARADAGLQNERIGVGSEVAGVQRQLTHAELHLARMGAHRIAPLAERGVEFINHEVNDLDRRGFSGYAEHVANRVVAAGARPAVEAGERVEGQALTGVGEAAGAAQHAIEGAGLPPAVTAALVDLVRQMGASLTQMILSSGSSIFAPIRMALGVMDSDPLHAGR